MTRTDSLRADDSLLLLGRLDGRLHQSPFTDIFLARSRLEGAAILASLAGVPIAVRDLQDWIAGRTPPPRASEGLNDPIAQATLNGLRSVLDDRAEATAYAGDDLAHFGPLWRRVRIAADEPFPSASLLGVAERVFSLAALSESVATASVDVVSLDGRALQLPSRQRDRNWLIGVAMPRLLYRAGFTSRVIPSLILLPKFLPPSPALLAQTLAEGLGRVAKAALRDLDVIERAATRLLAVRGVTRRSKAPILARLQLAYPGLQPAAVARLLKVTPQGARKLLASLARLS